jgi:hypothetical protein
MIQLFALFLPLESYYSEFSVISILLSHVRADMLSPRGTERVDMLSRVYSMLS